MGSAGHDLRSLYARYGEPIRFLVVGVWNTAFNYVLFAVLLWALEPVLKPLADSPNTGAAWVGEHWYLVVQWLAWILSVPQSTMALKLLVFHSKGNWAHEIFRAFFIYLPLQAFSSVSLWLLVTKGGMHPLLGQFFTVGITAVLSYLGHKYFTFRAAPHSEST